jgi:hypothetical protein
MPNPISRALSRAFNRIAYGETDPYAPLRQDGAAITGTGWWPSRDSNYDTSRVDYGRARKLYRNTIPQYKLGAHFARPIINFTAGYIGVPHFKSKAEVPEADEALDEFDQKFVSMFLTVNRNMLRDGDVFLRLDYVDDRFSKLKRFDLRLEHPEWCTPVLDPITGEWDALVITHPVYPTNRPDSNVQPSYVISETLTNETYLLKADERAPAEIRQRYPGVEVPNPWGFIPVVHYKNEPEENQLFGVSDLEPLEPLLRAYHDTMMVGNQGIRLFAKPKVKFTLKDVNRFLADNFADWKPGQPVNFQGHEIFLLTEGEDANYITAEPGTSGVGTLLEYLFYCIVQSAQIPEFVLGTAVASSRASVDTQMGPFVKTIERKRMMSTDPYVETHEMFLAMAAKAPGFDMPALLTYEVEPTWPEIAAKDEAAVAQTILTLFQAFQVGTSSGLVSMDAANEFLRDFVPTILPWLDSSGTEDERRRVMSSLAWLERVQGGGLPLGGQDVTDAEPTPPPPPPGQVAA